MLVYESIKSNFVNDVDLNQITDKILNKFKEVFHRGTSESEINSWRESMLRMRGVLADKDICSILLASAHSCKDLTFADGIPFGIREEYLCQEFG